MWGYEDGMFYGSFLIKALLQLPVSSQNWSIGSCQLLVAALIGISGLPFANINSLGIHRLASAEKKIKPHPKNNTLGFQPVNSEE